MAQNVTVAGASFSDVPSVVLPKTGGGSASFLDTTIASNAASASDITSGKLAFVNGELVTGTASGGGGGGLEYETGTWTPASDVADYTISFTKTHTTAPFLYMITYSGDNYYSETNTNHFLIFGSSYLLCGALNYQNSTTAYYGLGQARVRMTSATTFTGANIGASSQSALSDWVSTTGIRAYSNATGRYWRAARTYKWIAVWAPTS